MPATRDPPPPPRFVPGLGAIADRYAAFVLDQWGVLHDGARAYPGVFDSLAELRRRNKRVVLLSNSSRRAAHSRRHLAGLGFALPWFDAVVTSGETAWQGLKDRARPPFDRLGGRCVLVTRDGDLEVVEGTGVEVAAGPDDADFLFLAGVDSPAVGLEDLRPLLERAAARGLPALCSNPDLAAPSPGEIVIAPGTLARAYEAMGGTVAYVGKPHAPAYGPCLDTLEGLEAGEVLAVGDSLEHDVRGANGMGFDAALVTGGLHAADFPPGGDRAGALAALARLREAHGGRPDWVLPSIAW